MMTGGKRKGIPVWGSLLIVAVWLMAGLTNAHAGNTVTKITLVVTDPQGNVLMTTDAQGQVLARYTYRPYGTQQSGPTNRGPGYTGHVNDPATGLVYMQQRYYDPVVGRFASPDPIGPTPGNIYNFNRYAYANNNPIINIDSDGQQSHSDDKPQNSNCPWGGGAMCRRWRQRIRQWLHDMRRHIADMQKTLPGLKVTRSGRYKNGKYYVYQLTGPDGKSIACCNYFMKERLHIAYTGDHEGFSVNKRTVLNWFRLTRGTLGDQVGLDRTYENSPKQWKAVVIQTFLLRHNHKVTTLPVIFKHVIVFDHGYVTEATTTPVIPYNP